MKKYEIRSVVFVIVIIAISICIVLIFNKIFNDDESVTPKEEIQQQEVIRVISEDNTIMIDNVVIEKQKYLVFDVVRLDKTIGSVKFNVVLSYDGDPVFKKEIIVNKFENDSIKKKIEINKINYGLDELSVVLENIEKDVISN